MDFLDPHKRRNRQIRLMIGHSLMVVLVAFATYIFYSFAAGYDYDRKSGEVIQNGLLYIDSAPSNALIKINGQVHNSKTNTRLSLPGGVYTVEISKDGYHDWKRIFELEGGKVVRLSYPLLFPKELSQEELFVAKAPLQLSSQSPDRRWIVLMENNILDRFTLIDLKNRVDKKPQAAEISLPGNLFTKADGEHTLTLAEWSTDNKNVLLKHNFPGGQEYAVLNIDEPGNSFNLTSRLGFNPPEAALFDKKIEKFYTYDPQQKTLQLIDAASKQITSIGSNIISYQPHGDDIVLMARASALDPSKADIILRDEAEEFLIRQVAIDVKIPLAIASFSGDWYAAVGSEKEGQTYLYMNPREYIKSNANFDKTFLLALRSTGPIDQVSFSQNSRFILSQSGNAYNVYDAETKKKYFYPLKQSLDDGAKITWMDGHRLMSRSGGSVLVWDFNGINPRVLVPAAASLPVMFDQDFIELYSIGPSKADPALPALNRAYLRSADDR